MLSDPEVLRNVVRSAAERAFAAVKNDHPLESFYYFALVTTSDGLRPGPSASSHEGLGRTLSEYLQHDSECTSPDLRWSEADSPYNLYGDEFFGEVQRLFVEHREWPPAQYLAEVKIRFNAMESALRDLDNSGFFGMGAARHKVVINVVAPGDEMEDAVIERARRLNPPESLKALIKDIG